MGLESERGDNDVMACVLTRPDYSFFFSLCFLASTLSLNNFHGLQVSVNLNRPPRSVLKDDVTGIKITW